MEDFIIKVGEVVVCEVSDKQVAWNVYSGITYSCYGDKKSIYLGEELICSEPIRFTSNLVELEEMRLEKENLTSEELKDIRKIAEREITMEAQWANIRNEQIDTKRVDHALDVLLKVKNKEAEHEQKQA